MYRSRLKIIGSWWLPCLRKHRSVVPDLGNRRCQSSCLSSLTSHSPSHENHFSWHSQNGRSLVGSSTLKHMHHSSSSSVFTANHMVFARHLSLQSPSPSNDSDIDKPEASKGIIQRFKEAYKEYGKVLVCVHLATSAVWISAFYYAAYSGIDIIPLLEKLGFSESVTNTFKKAGVGDLAVAYVMYKLATPARYTVTIGGTQLTVRALRNYGYMEPVPEDSRLRNLYGDMKDGVKDKLQDRVDDVKGKYGDLKDDVMDKMKDKVDDVRDKMQSKVDGVRDKVQDKVEGVRDKVQDKVDSVKDKVDSMKDKVDSAKENVLDKEGSGSKSEKIELSGKDDKKSGS